ncbi:MAG: hypothetical protein ABIZ52_06070 [Candidatus Limnocylindrales bacterium]
MDPAIIEWDTMLADANSIAPAVSRRGTVRAQALATLRTTVLLILAALAILVLLPALAAQAASAG